MEVKCIAIETSDRTEYKYETFLGNGLVDGLDESYSNICRFDRYFLKFIPNWYFTTDLFLWTVEIRNHKMKGKA